MKLDRRAFLIGSAALLTSPAIAKPSKFMGAFSKGILKGDMDRKISDLLFSCMPTGQQLRSPDWQEDPVIFTFSRGNATVMQVQLNPRATYRWVAAQYSEILLPRREFLKLEIEPCHTSCVLTIISNTEMKPEHIAPAKMISDTFRWRDGELVEEATNYLSYAVNPVE